MCSRYLLREIACGCSVAPAPPDPPQVVSWSDIDINIVGSDAHEQVNYQAALSSLVLLKNEKVRF